MLPRDGVATARRLFASLLSVCLGVGLASVLAFNAVARADDRADTQQDGERADAIATARAYVERFYPLWFTYHQSLFAPHNELVGPDRISPIYQAVVAINDDTLYASTVIDVSAGPVILTIPETVATYSVLALDPYGNVFDSGVPSQPPGTKFPAKVYGLVPPNHAGALPSDIIRISMPLQLQFLIFRVDKFSPDGEDQLQQATDFRTRLKLQPLDDYLENPSGGATRVVPELAFAIPFKTIADTSVRRAPIQFLERLQAAVLSSNTPPLTPEERVLSDAFDALLGAGGSDLTPVTRDALATGARAAHEAILDNYLDNRGPNNWIHFTNMGKWGNEVLDRASIAEFIQYGNDIGAAAYYHTFRDGSGAPLVGSAPQGYVLTFAPGGQPPAERFWSLTAYTPDAIELIPNSANKYVVARYTPGLRASPDGSVSIHIAQTKPDGVPAANWLPVSDGAFNLMLRVYGVQPGSSVAEDTYVPPPVVPVVPER